MLSKKINKNGTICIPKTLRAEAGYHAGTAIDIAQNGAIITIKPHVPVCRFCGTVANIKSIFDITICTDCAYKIHEAVITND